MILSYGLRLAFVAFASFFAVNLAAGVVSLAMERLLRRRLNGGDPRRAAAAVLALRLAPVALALAAVAVFCVPSFLALEPAETSESANLLCLALATMGIASTVGGAARGIAAWWRSRRGFQSFEGCCETVRIPGRWISIGIVESRRPLLALVGLARPRVVATRAVLRALRPAELDAALRHERAHAAFRDNWKRLLIAIAPDVVPFPSLFRGLERSWAKYAERAADDRAVGNSERRSVALAAALVQVARLGAAAPAPVAASLLPDAGDLEARVERLLRGPAPLANRPGSPRAGWFCALGCVAATAAVCATYPLLLGGVHQLLERLMD